MQLRSTSSKEQPIVLTGYDLSMKQVIEIAKHETPVEIAVECPKKVRQGFEILMDAARQGKEVYGLTLGVGENKDVRVFGKDGSLTMSEDDLLERSREYNMILLRSHAVAANKYLHPHVVRAGMAIRLNTMLRGSSGVHPDVIASFKHFLNHDIVPIVPKSGSIGQADLTLNAAVGLALCGESDVFYKNEHCSATHALKATNFPRLRPVAKDALSIVSHNALTAGHAVLAVDDAERLLKSEIEVYPMCLEAMNGNIPPLYASTLSERAFANIQDAGKRLNEVLLGSGLHDLPKMMTVQANHPLLKRSFLAKRLPPKKTYDTVTIFRNTSDSPNTDTSYSIIPNNAQRKALKDAVFLVKKNDDPIFHKSVDEKLKKERNAQDPLCFRDTVSGIGECLENVRRATEALLTQINSSEDNPRVAIHESQTEKESKGSLAESYLVDSPLGKVGIFPTAHYNSLPFIARIQDLSANFQPLGVYMSNHVIQFENAGMTHLTRFLTTPNQNEHGLGEIAKTAVHAESEITRLSRREIVKGIAVSGGIEDISINSLRAVKNLEQMVNHGFTLCALQSICASEAIKLRGETYETHAMAPRTRELLHAFRQVAPPLSADRALQNDIDKAKIFLRNRAGEAGEIERSASPPPRIFRDPRLDAPTGKKRTFPGTPTSVSHTKKPRSR